MFGLQVISGLCVLAGVLWLYGRWRARRLGRDAAYWPTTRGEIIASDVTVETQGTAAGSITYYGVAIRYRYRLGWTFYEGSRITWQEPARHRNTTPFLGLLARYPVGRIVDVHYDPHQPSVAILEPQHRTAARLGHAASIAFLIIGPIGLVAAILT